MADTYVNGDHGCDDNGLRVVSGKDLSNRHPDVWQASEHGGAWKVAALRGDSFNGQLDLLGAPQQNNNVFSIKP